MATSLFDTAPAGASAVYAAMRDGAKPLAIEAREHCEDLWRDFAGCEDRNFLTEFPRDTQQRWFEMYLTVALMRAGFDVQCPKPGPDVLLTVDGRRIWIEATCAGAGQDGLPDSVPAPRVPRGFEPGIVSERPTDPMTLRIRNSLDTKEQKFRRYIADEIVAPGDMTVVAINVALIPRAFPDLDDLMRRALYGLGHPTVTIDKDTLSVVARGYQERPEIRRQSSGSPVNLQPFIDDNMPHISAVLGSREDAYNRPPRLGDWLVLFPNLSATVPWSAGAIRLGEEWIPTRLADGDVQLEKTSYIAAR